MPTTSAARRPKSPSDLDARFMSSLEE